MGMASDGSLFWVGMQRSVIRLANFELNSIQLTEMDSSLCGIFIIGKDELIISCNATPIFSLFGYRGRDLIGQHIHSFISKKNIKLFQEYTRPNTTPAE
jgi:hypothetical protein